MLGPPGVADPVCIPCSSSTPVCRWICGSHRDTCLGFVEPQALGRGREVIGSDKPRPAQGQRQETGSARLPPPFLSVAPSPCEWGSGVRGRSQRPQPPTFLHFSQPRNPVALWKACWLLAWERQGPRRRAQEGSWHQSAGWAVPRGTQRPGQDVWPGPWEPGALALPSHPCITPNRTSELLPPHPLVTVRTHPIPSQPLPVWNPAHSSPPGKPPGQC